jgi:hypothetical protein
LLGSDCFPHSARDPATDRLKPIGCAIVLSLCFISGPVPVGAQAATAKISTFLPVELGEPDVRTILDEGVIPQTQFLRGLLSPGSDRLREPNRDLRNRRPFLLLSAGVYGLAILDMHETVSVGGYEHDPLTRPFVKLTPPAYYAGGIALATGVNWMAAKMERSRRWRRIWWLPQACSMAGNLWGYTSTKARE